MFRFPVLSVLALIVSGNRFRVRGDRPMLVHTPAAARMPCAWLDACAVCVLYVEISSRAVYRPRLVTGLTQARRRTG